MTITVVRSEIEAYRVENCEIIGSVRLASLAGGWKVMYLGQSWIEPSWPVALESLEKGKSSFDRLSEILPN